MFGIALHCMNAAYLPVHVQVKYNVTQQPSNSICYGSIAGIP